MRSRLERRLKANRVIGFLYFRDHGCTLPGKHSLDLCGRPVYYWKLRAALESEYMEKILIWTEIQEALDMARDMSDRFIVKKRKLSECVEPEYMVIDDLRTPQSEKSIYTAFNRHRWHDGYWGDEEAEDIFGFIPSASVNLCCNSPLEMGSDFDRLVEAYYSVDDANEATLACRIDPDIVMKTPGGFIQPLCYIPGMPRQQMMPIYTLAGTFLSGKRQGIYYRRWKSILVEVPRNRGIHVHTKEDLALAEFYMNRRLNK